MIDVFSIPSRQYNNRSFTTNSVRLGQHLDISTFWLVLLRLEIESVAPGASLTITYSMHTGGGEYLGGSTCVLVAPGRHQIGFSRGNFDDNTVVAFDITLVDRMTLNGIVYVCSKGEDIPEWL